MEKVEIAQYEQNVSPPLPKMFSMQSASENPLIATF